MKIKDVHEKIKAEYGEGGEENTIDIEIKNSEKDVHEKIKKDFENILKFNQKGDWNNPIFRKTIVNAFRFCANKYLKKCQEQQDKQVEELKKKFRGYALRINGTHINNIVDKTFKVKKIENKGVRIWKQK